MAGKLKSRGQTYWGLAVGFIVCICCMAACQGAENGQGTLPAETMGAEVTVASATATSGPTPSTTPIAPITAGFPLQPGATWVYSHTAYFGTATSTYIITETVMSLEIRDAYWIAEMARQWQPVAGTLKEADVSGLDVPHHWYIFDLPNVYHQRLALDLGEVENAWLEYRLPMDAYASWYPDPGQRQAGATGFAGQRRVEEVGVMVVPAGTFANCFLLFTGFNNGPTRDWFCEGVGLVERQFDHQGTSYGYHTILINMGTAVEPNP